MEINVGDKFLLRSINGLPYIITVVNISFYRPDDMRYAIDIADGYGNPINIDFEFVGEDFFSKDSIERIAR